MDNNVSRTYARKQDLMESASAQRIMKVMGTPTYKKLRAARLHAGLTQEQLAERLGISRAAVAQWEAKDPAKRTHPDLERVQDFCAATGAPLMWLLDEAQDISSDWGVVADVVPLPAPPSFQADNDDDLLNDWHMLPSTERQHIREQIREIANRVRRILDDPAIKRTS